MDIGCLIKEIWGICVNYIYFCVNTLKHKTALVNLAHLLKVAKIL